MLDWTHDVIWLTITKSLMRDYQTLEYLIAVKEIHKKRKRSFICTLSTKFLWTRGILYKYVSVSGSEHLTNALEDAQDKLMCQKDRKNKLHLNYDIILKFSAYSGINGRYIEARSLL